MVYTFEAIGIVFVLVMIYLTYLEYKRKRLFKLGFIFWNLVWIGGILLILFHNLVNNILSPINIVRVLDLYMILAFMFLFAVIFYLYLRNSRTEQRLEDLTRTITLKKIKVKEKNER